MNCEPIGKHKFCFAGGETPLFAWRPIYGFRITLIQRKPTPQALIMCFGTPTWINVALHDVKIKGLKA